MSQNTLDLEGARRLVLSRRYEMPEPWFEPDFLLPGEETRCVDEREGRRLPILGETLSPEKMLPRVALPGASLGIFITIFTAIHQLELARKRPFNINFRQIIIELESLYGPARFHTDTKSSEIVLPCAGCGHCKGALSRTGGMSAEAITFFKEDYIPGLVGRGIFPAIYEGEHDAQAVMLVTPLEIGIAPSIDVSGLEPRVFVLNQGWNKRLIRRAANQIFFKVMRRFAPDVTIGEFVDKVAYEAGKQQLGYTLKALAENLPLYVVKFDEHGNIVVEKASKLEKTAVVE